MSDADRLSDADLHALTGAYALNALDEQEAAAFARHSRHVAAAEPGGPRLPRAP